jgi:ADP-heptose:LPS heptosyltransferase
MLLAGPAIRAAAAGCDQVTVLAGPRGADAARLLPGVGDVLVWLAPWVDLDPPPVAAGEVAALVRRLAAGAFTDAVIFTSFHQSPLPTALLLRLAGIGRIAAISEDYPGSLLDVRHRLDGDMPEAERALSLARAAGFDLPPGDGGLLAVRHPLPEVAALTGDGPYVVLHPGATAPARCWPAAHWAQAVAELAARGRRVLLTGGGAERDLTAMVAAAAGTLGSAAGAVMPGPAARAGTPGAAVGSAARPSTLGQAAGLVTDLGGRTGLAELAAVLAGADAVMVANTGVAHLAAAVSTPVVSLFAPVVPAARWAPYGVPVILLGDQSAPCRGSRAVRCPVPGHPCLSSVTAVQACDALDRLTAGLAAVCDQPPELL